MFSLLLLLLLLGEQCIDIEQAVTVDCDAMQRPSSQPAASRQVQLAVVMYDVVGRSTDVVLPTDRS